MFPDQYTKPILAYSVSEICFFIYSLLFQEKNIVLMTADCLYLRNRMEPPERAKFEEKGCPS